MIEGNTALKQKTKKPVAQPSARPKTRMVNVAHPTVPGAVESVHRIVDGTDGTIDAMFKRRQIDAGQKRAAERLRLAWDTVHGSVGGVMDMDKVRGAGSPGAPPAPCYMFAAEDLNVAKLKLYALDHRILELVVCRGYRIDSAAAIIHRCEIPSRQEKERIGDRFREGLRELASLWFPTNAGDANKIGVYHAPDADPKLHAFTAKAGVREIDTSKGVHADGRRVFRRE